MPARDSYDRIFTWILIVFGFAVYGLFGSVFAAIIAVAVMAIGAIWSGHGRLRSDQRQRPRRRL